MAKGVLRTHEPLAAAAAKQRTPRRVPRTRPCSHHRAPGDMEIANSPRTWHAQTRLRHLWPPASSRRPTNLWWATYRHSWRSWWTDLSTRRQSNSSLRHTSSKRRRSYGLRGHLTYKIGVFYCLDTP
jgi:hypothetical protein